MATIPLPENPSLEALVEQAELAMALVETGDESTIAFIGEFLPDWSGGDATFDLTTAQLGIARLYGFDDWNAAAERIEVMRALSFTPWAERDDALAAHDRFVVDACLDYAQDGPRPEVRVGQAAALLAAEPGVLDGSIAALAVVGDHVQLAKTLENDPEAANRRCGPNGWPPLLYATYSRLVSGQPEHSAEETVRVLLAHGADPNAGILWRGLVPPFTALTGALGGGEDGRSVQRDGLAIARLLLEAGADPNDGQGLYNRGLGGPANDDSAYLELLVEFGLGTPTGGPWYERLDGQLREPSELLRDELEVAALQNRVRTFEFLMQLGLDLEQPVGRSHKPPARVAAEAGSTQVLDLLAAAGASGAAFTPLEAALAATRKNDVAGLDGLLADHPDLLGELQQEHPGLCRNVGPAHSDMLDHLLSLGFDIDALSGTKTALVLAAEHGDTALARLLVDRGADPNLADSHIGASPLGWASYSGHDETAAYLASVTETPPPQGQ